MKSKFLLSFISLTFSGLFVFLGFWQLGRAQDINKLKQSKPDAPAVAIEKIAHPGVNLDGNAVNRIVKLKGIYVKSYIAPKQKTSTESRASYEVRLMKLNSGSGILVVRGVQNLNEQILPNKIEVLGRLYPRQNSDVAKYQSGELTRIDPALITADTNLNLIDGYVIAISESNEFGQPISTDRILANPLLPKVAGFYWQHIAYVVIWWLFALLVLLAPFYDRVRDRKLGVK